MYFELWKVASDRISGARSRGDDLRYQAFTVMPPSTVRT